MEAGDEVSGYTFRQDYRDSEKFILMMSDHVFGVDTLSSFILDTKKSDDNYILSICHNLRGVLRRCASCSVRIADSGFFNYRMVWMAKLSASSF
jgi:hypothetical protein